MHKKVFDNGAQSPGPQGSLLQPQT